MSPEVFDFWYSRLDLQPVDTMEFVTVCKSTPLCKQCKLRSDCPLRPLFYMDEIRFETHLQSSEVKIKNFFSKIVDSEDVSEIAFISTEKIRLKRREELIEYPEYSAK